MRSVVDGNVVMRRMTVFQNVTGAYPTEVIGFWLQSEDSGGGGYRSEGKRILKITKTNDELH